MKNKRYFLIAVGIVACCVAGWIFFRTSLPSPGEQELKEKMTRTVELGWPLLKASNVMLEDISRDGDTRVATFLYTVTLATPYHALPAAERERVDTFLPMCLSLFQEGKTSCTLRESMVFVHNAKFGWVPALMLEHRPELLDAITAK